MILCQINQIHLKHRYARTDNMIGRSLLLKSASTPTATESSSTTSVSATKTASGSSSIASSSSSERHVAAKAILSFDQEKEQKKEKVDKLWRVAQNSIQVNRFSNSIVIILSFERMLEDTHVI